MGRKINPKHNRSREDYREYLVFKYRPMEENYAWDYWDEYAFWEDVDFIIKDITHDIRPKSNQALETETKSACTIIWALNQIIRLFGLDLDKKTTRELWKEVVNYCIQFWYKIGGWWDTPTAINSVCKFWNEIGSERYGTEKVFYSRQPYNTEKPKEALRKWHLVWFTMALDFGDDKYKGLVRRDSYPWGKGHRLNWQSTKTTKPSWWASEPTADCGVYDNYYWYTNQYLIRDRSKYMNKWMYTPAYMIFPQSWLKKTIEENKKEITENKAMNYVIMALSTAYASVPEKYQTKFAELAKEIRAEYKETRGIMADDKQKWAAALTDALSYLYKFADAEDQKIYAELATKLRDKHWI